MIEVSVSNCDRCSFNKSCKLKRETRDIYSQVQKKVSTIGMSEYSGLTLHLKCDYFERAMKKKQKGVIKNNGNDS